MEKESGRVGEGLLGPNVISCIAQIIDDCQDLLVEPDEEEEGDITEAEWTAIHQTMNQTMNSECRERRHVPFPRALLAVRRRARA